MTFPQELSIVACYDKNMEQSFTKTFAVGVALLAVGLFGGYYYGQSVGIEKGKLAAQLEAKKAAEDAAAAAEKLAAQAANPFAGTANPLQGVSVNPFEKVNVNPFAQ